MALVGNPNTGKTTLFNRLTGANARVGNYPGVTVDRTVGRARLPDGQTVDMIDVPGTYSLVGRTSDEQIAIDAILGRHGNPRPDLVVQVIDAANLERNLYLTLQLCELELPLILAINMVDEVEAAGGRVDIEALEAAFGVPVVPTIGVRKDSLGGLAAALQAGLTARPHAAGWLWSPSSALSADLDALVPVLGAEIPEDAADGVAWAVALWALMSLDVDDELAGIPGPLRARVLARLRDAHEADRDVDAEAVTARYRWIDERAEGFITRGEAGNTLTARVDRVLLHPVAGFAVFLGIMFTVFQALFAWSDPFIGLIEGLMGGLSELARGALPAGILADFVCDALIGGVGNVIVFLPQILLLFLFIGIMEDSGYMARAAFLMDRVMNRIGLHGRAFVPMLSAYACAVPAIMSTRTMERRRDRFLTMMAIPLTTCSARLPVYTLIIGALIPATTVLGVVNQQSLVMIGMYLFGIVVALCAAAVLGRTVLKGSRVPLLLELPAYRRPDPRSVGRLVYSRGRLFVKEAGTVILVCTVLLWGLLYFPRTGPEVQALEAQIAAAQSAGQAEQAATLESAVEGARVRNSYAGRLGRFIEPAIAPLGFDWKVGVGLIGAFAAREVFVSTMGVVYSLGADVDEESDSLRDRMAKERHADGRLVYTPLMGLSLLIFFALACQCMSTLAAVKRETRGYRWPVFLFVYMTALAWICSLVFYQGGQLLGFT